MDGVMRKMVRVAAFATALLLAGCWESDKELIADEQASDPFDGAQFIMYRYADANILLERRPGKHAVFAAFEPEKSMSDPVRFLDIGDFRSWFGNDRYIIGMGRTYGYAEQDGQDWTLFELPGAARRATSIENLIAQIEESRESGKLKAGVTVLLEPIDSAVAAAFKQQRYTELEQKKQLAEIEARQKEIEAREQQVREEAQKLRDEAQQARIGRLEEELAAARRNGQAATSASAAAPDDREPTEYEMSEAIRGDRRWRDLQCLGDEARRLSQAGRVRLRLPLPMAQRELGQFLEGGRRVVLQDSRRRRSLSAFLA